MMKKYWQCLRCIHHRRLGRFYELGERCCGCNCDQSAMRRFGDDWGIVEDVEC